MTITTLIALLLASEQSGRICVTQQSNMTAQRLVAQNVTVTVFASGTIQSATKSMQLNSTQMAELHARLFSRNQEKQSHYQHQQ